MRFPKCLAPASSVGCRERAQHPAGQTQPGPTGLPRELQMLMPEWTHSPDLWFTRVPQELSPLGRAVWKPSFPSHTSLQRHFHDIDQSQMWPLSHIPGLEGNWKAPNQWMLLGSWHTEPWNTKLWHLMCPVPTAHSPSPLLAVTIPQPLKPVLWQLQQPFKRDRINPRWTSREAD